MGYNDDEMQSSANDREATGTWGCVAKFWSGTRLRRKGEE